MYNHEYGIVSEELDFLCQEKMYGDSKNIIMNPPYKFASEFVVKAIDLIPENGIVCAFLKTTFLEGRKRFENIFSKNPPKYIFQYVNRISCKENGRPDDDYKISSAISYAWFVWYKKNEDMTTEIKWIV